MSERIEAAKERRISRVNRSRDAAADAQATAPRLTQEKGSARQEHECCCTKVARHAATVLDAAAGAAVAATAWPSILAAVERRHAPSVSRVLAVKQRKGIRRQFAFPLFSSSGSSLSSPLADSLFPVESDFPFCFSSCLSVTVCVRRRESFPLILLSLRFPLLCSLIWITLWQSFSQRIPRDLFALLPASLASILTLASLLPRLLPLLFLD